MTEQTTLNATHRALNARMVDFGGWDMPLNYGSQIEEHLAVRANCGIFDVSHMCMVDVAGGDVLAFLQKLLAGNIGKITQSGKALYSAMLNEKGGVIDDLIVFFMREGHYKIVVNAGCAEKDIEWMRTCKDAWNMEVGIMPRRDLSILAIQGPAAKAKFWQCFPETRASTENLKPFFGVEIGSMFVSTTGYTGEAGFEVALPIGQTIECWEKLVKAGAIPAGLAARDTLRLEAGMNLYGQDMDENVSPLNAGMGWTVDLTGDRDFVGKEVLVKNGAQHQFLGLVLEDKGGILRAHQKVFCAEDKEGEITSGTFSPSLQKSIALARLPLEAKIGDIVYVDIRGKKLKAVLVKPAFVRNGKALV